MRWVSVRACIESNSLCRSYTLGSTSACRRSRPRPSLAAISAVSAASSMCSGLMSGVPHSALSTARSVSLSMKMSLM